MYDITSSIRVTSYPLHLWHHTHDVRHHNPVCGWHHTRHIYDIVCTIEDVTSTLSQQTTVFMMSHLLQAWHHTHCIFCHHNLSTDITPILYDIKPTICVTSYALYITSHPLFMSSHYCTYDIKSSIYQTTSSILGNIYTIHVTSQPLICVITPTVLTSSHPIFLRHHTRHMYGIFCPIQDITS